MKRLRRLFTRKPAWDWTVARGDAVRGDPAPVANEASEPEVRPHGPGQCPGCGAVMLLYTPSRGAFRGKRYLVCPRATQCPVGEPPRKDCPSCGAAMWVQAGRKGKHVGRHFYWCERCRLAGYQPGRLTSNSTGEHVALPRTPKRTSSDVSLVK